MLVFVDDRIAGRPQHGWRPTVDDRPIPLMAGRGRKVPQSSRHNNRSDLRRWTRLPWIRRVGLWVALCPMCIIGNNCSVPTYAIGAVCRYNRVSVTSLFCKSCGYNGASMVLMWHVLSTFHFYSVYESFDRYTNFLDKIVDIIGAMVFVAISWFARFCVFLNRDALCCAARPVLNAIPNVEQLILCDGHGVGEEVRRACRCDDQSILSTCHATPTSLRESTALWNSSSHLHIHRILGVNDLYTDTRCVECCHVDAPRTTCSQHALCIDVFSVFPEFFSAQHVTASDVPSRLSNV